MTAKIFKKLAHHLDDLPGGFPPTDSGVELRILQRLFTEEEAELAIRLSLIPEEAHVIARRARISVQDAGMRLGEMSQKGLIYRIAHHNGQTLYMASQFVIGIWEYHVNDLSPELIEDMELYAPTLLDQSWKKVPQLRTIPIGRSITPQLDVLPYEVAEKLVWDKKKAVVAPCICRKERQMVGEGCDRPLEACLVFGMGADYYQHNGLGRVIERSEVLDILKQADKSGLVLQPGNSRKIVNICCCCGCCCGILRNVKLQPNPASLIASAFIVAFDPETCNGCGVCVKRCQMDALELKSDKELKEDKAALDLTRCIGCGLCVSTCPTKSLTLVRKPESEQPETPANVIETGLKLGRARGKLGSMSFAKMRLQSKIDRLLAVKK